MASVSDSKPEATEAVRAVDAAAIGDLLHDRIGAACRELYDQAHYKHAAREAMTQVELALREATLAPKRLFGRRLIDHVFGSRTAVSLTVPLGSDMQHAARALFRAAFLYYRNYAAHDGSKIDRKIAARVLILASELLDLLDATPRSLQIEGGPEGLAEHGHFVDADDFGGFLAFIDGKNYPDEVWDGLLEDLAMAGFGWEQIELTKELGLVEERGIFPEEVPWGDLKPDWEWLTIFELTALGKDVLLKLDGVSGSTEA